MYAWPFIRPDGRESTTTPSAFAPSGIRVLPSTTTGEITVAAKDSPELFWLVAREWSRRTWMAVPAGTVIWFGPLTVRAANSASASSGIATAPAIRYFRFGNIKAHLHCSRFTCDWMRLAAARAVCACASVHQWPLPRDMPAGP